MAGARIGVTALGSPDPCRRALRTVTKTPSSNASKADVTEITVSSN
jgi:hypothetical protein